MLHAMVTAGEKLNKTDVPVMASPLHIQHCIELLRQALTCNPDLTIEVKNVTTNGVHGFGVAHQCVDWSALKSWTGHWETYGQDTRP